MKKSFMILAALVLLSGTMPGSIAAANGLTGEASVFIVHGIPGQDLGLDPDLPVDVSADGVCLLSGFRFGEIVGPVSIAAGVYNIQISPADMAIPCSNAPVIDATFGFSPGENATVIAHLAANGALTASKFTNNIMAMPKKNKARMILHHTAAVPAVDVTIQRGNSKKKKMTVPGVENGDQAAAMLNPGNWNLHFAPAGSGVPVFSTRAQLRPRTIHLVYAVGSLQNGTFTLLRKVIRPAVVQTPSVIVVHGIPGEDLGLDPDLPVDISVDGECTLSGVTFGGIAGPIPLPPGAHHVAISSASPMAPCGEAVILDATVDLGPHENATLIAHLLSEGTPTVSKFSNDLTGPRPGRANIIVHHVAAAPAVDIVARRPYDGPIGLTITDLENGEKAGDMIRPGDWEIFIAPAGSGMPVYDTMVSLKPHTIHLVYAVGSVSGGTFDLLIKRLP